MPRPLAVSETVAAVHYHSSGRVAVLGPPDRLDRARLLSWPEPLQPTFFAKPVELKGYLGNFEIEGELFDLVVDLFPEPLLKQEVPPFGYFPLGDDPSKLRERLPELAEWVGTFEKPKYFHYDPDRCAHGYGNFRGCERCLEVCAAEAISPVGTKIEIHPYLCQGCGDCVSACPTGAIEFRPPPSFCELLETVREKVIFGKPLFFHLPEAELEEPLKEAIAIEPLGRMGPEIWLSALTLGASAVVLVRSEGVLQHTFEHLSKEMAWVNALLEGLGYGRRIFWLGEGKLWPDRPLVREPARFAPLGDKREQLWLALDYLLLEAPEGALEVPLPEGAPLGTVEIDPRRCTLCMACVSICPSGALQAGGPSPEIRLVERDCLQCRLCERGCPEAAVRLRPRLLTDLEKLKKPRHLVADEPLRCLGCGKIFANRRLIEALLARVGSHPMFQGQRRRRLFLCETCRLKEMI